MMFFNNLKIVPFADLRGADLSGADLYGASLYGANLRETDLRGADLYGANLCEADLSGAHLRGANLRGADLSGASLRGTGLRGTNLCGANLEGTALDPAAVVPAIADEELAAAGLEVDGDWVTGWRTSRSVHVGSTNYIPGRVYAAGVFSVCAETTCHPGLYLASADWMRANYCGKSLVRCRCLRSELIHAGDKWRAKRLWIIEG